MTGLSETPVSPSTVSDLNKKIYGTIAAWRNRPIEGEHPYVLPAAKLIGRVGAELDVEVGRKAAHLAALNVLAVARQHFGSLDKVTRIVRLGVSVATSGDVRDQPKVADAPFIGPSPPMPMMFEPGSGGSPPVMWMICSPAPPAFATRRSYSWRS